MQNSPKNLSAKKVKKHNLSGVSMSTMYSFRGIENKRNVYSSKYCMKRFCEFLREHAMKMINQKNEIINKRAARII